METKIKKPHLEAVFFLLSTRLNATPCDRNEKKPRKNQEKKPRKKQEKSKKTFIC